MPIDTAISSILQTGLLGALVVLLGGVVVYQNKELTKERLERLKDWQSGNMTNIQTITEIKITLQRLLDLLTQSGKNND
jgi:hypothetical protein